MAKRDAVAEKATKGKRPKSARRETAAVAAEFESLAAVVRAWFEAAPPGSAAHPLLQALATVLHEQLNVQRCCVVFPASLAEGFDLEDDGDLVCFIDDERMFGQLASEAGRAVRLADVRAETGVSLAEALRTNLPKRILDHLDRVVAQPLLLIDDAYAGLICEAPSKSAAQELCRRPALPAIAHILADRLSQCRLGLRLESVQHDLDRRLFHLLTLLDFSGDFLRHAQHEHTLTTVLFTAMGHLGTHAGCLFLAEKESGELQCQRWRGVADDGMAELRVTESDPLVRAVKEQAAPIHRDELSRAWQASALRRRAPLADLEMYAPLTLGDRLVGFFMFGPKLSGDPYSDDDLEFLAILSSQAAMAVENARLVSDLEAARRELLSENRNLRRALSVDSQVRNIIGKSDGIQRVLEIVQRICDTPVSVLITGESGTGKELVARAVHYSGTRANRPFVSLNCAALPETLIESELFGIEAGVATGVAKNIGKIEQANGGTLFLDEVGDMTLAMQAKLLRVVQERELQRVGGRVTLSIDVRIIAATNKDLEAGIRERTFREDLYYRLNVVAVHLPPLRERRDDIALLARHLLDKAMARLEKRGMSFSAETMQALIDYPWPGNVRELENELERLVALVDEGSRIGPEWLSEKIRLAPPPLASDHEALNLGLKEQVGRYESEIIRRALAEHGGIRSAVARRLGLSGEGLRKKLIKYGLT